MCSDNLLSSSKSFVLFHLSPRIGSSSSWTVMRGGALCYCTPRQISDIADSRFLAKDSKGRYGHPEQSCYGAIHMRQQHQQQSSWTSESNVNIIIGWLGNVYDGRWDWKRWGWVPGYPRIWLGWWWSISTLDEVWPTWEYRWSLWWISICSRISTHKDCRTGSGKRKSSHLQIQEIWEWREFPEAAPDAKVCPMSESRGCIMLEGTQEVLPMEGLSMCKLSIGGGKAEGDGSSGCTEEVRNDSFLSCNYHIYIASTMYYHYGTIPMNTADPQVERSLHECLHYCSELDHTNGADRLHWLLSKWA